MALRNINHVSEHGWPVVKGKAGGMAVFLGGGGRGIGSWPVYLRANKFGKGLRQASSAGKYAKWI